jgi:ferredoxin-thioredoxin reductase catalytic subunit
MTAVPEQAKIEALYKQLNDEAEAAGYHLNPDIEFTKDLIKALLANENRYGYRICPCRRAAGKKDEDLDIICPCDYRDPDLNDYGCCYCALYVSEKIKKGEQKSMPIPERRPASEQREKLKQQQYPVWRCKVCGYLCARENPPEICPICKVAKDRFERFI